MYFVIVVGVLAGVLLAWFGLRKFRHLRRTKLRARPFPAASVGILERNVRLYRKLPADLRADLHSHISVFLDEKVFFGCDGLEITDEIRVTVAGHACLLLLNGNATYFPGFSTILIYPDAYVAPEVEYDGELEHHSQATRAGESWHRGPVILSWRDVLRDVADSGGNQNVVIHEFAHKLDEENESVDGLPILRDSAHYHEWAEVLSREFNSLSVAGQDQVLDDYAAESPAEFFAVASETFFEQAQLMRAQLPELYEQLRRFYRVDPAIW